MQKCLKMKAAGVPAAELVSYGEVLRNGVKTTFLCTLNLDGYVSFDEWQIQLANDITDIKFEQKKTRFLSEMAAVMNSCHKAHIYKFGWAVKHIWLKETDDGSIKIKLIDVKRAVLPGFKDCIIPFRHTRRRVIDLTEFNTQLYLNVFTLRDRLFTFRKYSHGIFSRKERKEIVDKIIHDSIKSGYFQYKVKKNKIFVNPELSAQIKEIGNMSYDDIMRQEGLELITRKKVRTVVTVVMGGHKWYLKRHIKPSVKDSLLEDLRYKKPVSNAKLEWRAIEILTAIGIPNVQAIAMGEKFKDKYIEKSSFIITEELKDGRSLEQILNEKPALSFKDKVRLIERIGSLARKLHTFGLTHRDFYLGHIFVVGSLEGEYKLHLLDLQRVKFGAKIYNRWSVKDISALLFSSLNIPGITRADRMRFLFKYLKIQTLTTKDKLFVYKLLAKNDKIAKHTVKLLEKRRKSGELPPLTND